MAEERDVAFAMPATLINRFYVVAGDDRTRIAFGEADGDKYVYRFAISLNNADATALVDLIKQMHSTHQGEKDKPA